MLNYRLARRTCQSDFPNPGSKPNVIGDFQGHILTARLAIEARRGTRVRVSEEVCQRSGKLLSHRLGLEVIEPHEEAAADRVQHKSRDFSGNRLLAP